MRTNLLWPSGFSLLVCLAVLWPITENWQPKPQDDFPLSYYPMFSHRRDSTYRTYYLLGYDAQGTRHLLHYAYAGSGGFNQARRRIRKQARRGKGEALLERVAARWAKRAGADAPKLTRLVLARGEFHLERFFLENQRAPLQEDVMATLPLPTDE